MKNVNICDKCIREDFQERLIRMFSSSNINVLLGSGFSRPLLSVLGKIETDLTKAKRDNNKDEIFRVEKEFFSSCMLPLRNIEEVMKTCPQRNKFIYSIIEIISARHSSILHKTLNFFTTNYDNLIEMSLEERNIDYFDGFTGRISSVFSTNNYGKIISKQSAINNKTSEIVSVNLIKLHGSLYWYKNNDKIIYKDFNERLERLELAKDDVDAFISLYEQEFLIVNPNEEKYNLTVLNETYYDQIRLMSNELDKNNTLLIVYGFSFNDNHLKTIIDRALKNPTLTLIVFAYNEDALRTYELKFGDYNNVIVIYKAQCDEDGIQTFEYLTIDVAADFLEEIAAKCR